VSDTRALLNRIAAVRDRLGHAHEILHDAEIPPTSPKRTIVYTAKAQRLVTESLQQVAKPQRRAKSKSIPLTNRVRACAERCRDVVDCLRQLQPSDDESAIAAAHRRCIAMTHSAVRLIQNCPESTSDQIRLGGALEALLDSLDEHLARLSEAVVTDRRNEQWIEQLSHAFTVLGRGDMLALDLFLELATAIEHDARAGKPLRILVPGPISLAADADAGHAWLLRLVATHALNTAHVAARIVRNIPGSMGQGMPAIVASLLHDVGLVATSFTLLAHPGRISGEQVREIEAHPVRGAEIVATQIPQAAPLADGIRQHHERLDGSGYPCADRSPSHLARIIAVADAYAALRAPRPYRDALDPRAAMIEMMLASQRGSFDGEVVSALRKLGFYPPGCVVELNDGRLGAVVAVHSDPNEPELPAHAVIAQLTDAEGECLCTPCCVDLGVDETCAISRALAHDERMKRLGEHYPQLI
jgi:HD-GYP domain-containing protein (c-di-GMP phosphodiesterase class II)